MGYIAHDAVVAVLGDWQAKEIEDVAAFRESMPEHLRPFLVGPVVGTNGYHSYAFLPDGSKEGWPDSDEASHWRHTFAALMAAGDMVALRFGGDFGNEHGSTITSATDRVDAA